jgi:hypothetical protein
VRVEVVAGITPVVETSFPAASVSVIISPTKMLSEPVFPQIWQRMRISPVAKTNCGGKINGEAVGRKWSYNIHPDKFVSVGLVLISSTKLLPEHTFGTGVIATSLINT